MRITADTEGIGPFEIPVTQEGKPEFDSTLAEDVDFGTLTGGNYVIVYLTKNEEQAYALWDLRFWSDGVTFDMNTGTYSGSGDLVTVYLVSEPVYKTMTASIIYRMVHILWVPIFTPTLPAWFPAISAADTEHRMRGRILGTCG